MVIKNVYKTQTNRSVIELNVPYIKNKVFCSKFKHICQGHVHICNYVLRWILPLGIFKLLVVEVLPSGMYHKISNLSQVNSAKL